jgi:hypothetical protein
VRRRQCRSRTTRERAATTRPESSGDGERFLGNWRDEVDSTALYRALADLESDSRLAGVYGRLAAAEERHAGFWEERLRAAGARVPERRPSWRTRLLIALGRLIGGAVDV